MKEAGMESAELTEKREKIGEILRAGVEKLVVHGDHFFKEGEINLRLRPDLDAMAGIYLMNLAGIDYRMVQFEHKGQWVPGAVHIDTGGRKELTIEDDGSVFFDHHGSEKGKHTSATEIVYDTLVETGFLERQKWLDRMVSFVNEIDNMTYPLDEDFFRKKWWQTLYGTYKVLPIEVVANFFKEGRDPREPFGLEYSRSVVLKKSAEKTATLADVAEHTRNLVAMSLQNISKAARRMEELGVKTETPELGKVVLNAVEQGKKNKIPLGFSAVKALGYDTYILWSEEHHSFFISSQERGEEIYEKVKASVPSAKLIRGTMILVPPTEAPQDLTLGVLLASLGLKEYTGAMPGFEGKEKLPTKKEAEMQDPFVEILEEMKTELAGKKISPAEFRAKKAVLERIRQAENALAELRLALAQSEIAPAEYRKLRDALKEKSALPKPEETTEDVEKRMRHALFENRQEEFQKKLAEGKEKAPPVEGEIEWTAEEREKLARLAGAARYYKDNLPSVFPKEGSGYNYADEEYGEMLRLMTKSYARDAYRRFGLPQEHREKVVRELEENGTIK